MVNFADVIERISVPVLVVDEAGIIIHANQRSLDHFPSIRKGETAQVLWGKGTGLKKLLRKALHLNEPQPVSKFTSEFDRREFKVTAGVLDQGLDQSGTLIVLTFEDLTSMRAAKSMRSDFVANVSHEIRSPLTAISGFIESLQDAEDIDDETRKMFFGMMAKEVTRMTNLVADLLSLSKVEAKEKREVTKQVNIVQVLQQACASVNGLMNERGAKVELQIIGDLPAVLGKYDDLLRVFINLAENAINYSRDSGTVVISAEVKGKTNPFGKDAICVSVIDEGEGIPAGEIPRLTERFYRVDKSRSRNVGGTGLGLAIVKHILVRHHGKLVIKSTPGLGSTFSVYLPIVLS